MPSSSFVSRLLRLGRFFARPAAGHPREPAARAVIGQTAHRAEDRALDDQGGHELGERDLTVLGARCLLVVEQAPDLVEDLLAQLARTETGGDPDGQEDELHATSTSPSFSTTALIS